MKIDSSSDGEINWVRMLLDFHAIVMYYSSLL